MREGSLKEILPLLRPRSAEPTLFTQTVWYLLWVGLAILVILYLYRLCRQRKQRHADFLAVCQEAGLSVAQTSLLEKVAKSRKLQQPERLISSAHAFERQVGGYAQQLAHRHPKHKHLRQIGRLREELGFDDLPADQALISTRQIDRGQRVMLLDIDEQTHEEILIPWLVLERDEAVLELSPLLREVGGHQIRRGEHIDVRFWREGDTEYHFQGLVRSVQGENLTIPHATRVERMQHRDFYRIHVDFPVDLYGLHQGEDTAEAANQSPEAAGIALLGEDGSSAEEGGSAEISSGEMAADQGTVESGAEDPSAETIPEDAERLHGRVENLSAGGLAVVLAAGALPEGSLAQQAGEAEWLWMIDPAFEDEFPLAGVICRAVSTETVAAGEQLVKMQFEGLPTAVEKEIVQRVYQHQLDTAGGAPSPPRPTQADIEIAPEEEPGLDDEIPLEPNDSASLPDEA
ncbi:MAG: PilZ domain-containing protein [Gemmatimonadetes bacterium]|mgnify:CR=1 FL=1|nr:PilZ domain-containing protein [Gemmatimonadota bacterium]MBT5143716.1 PilZ domain-containing protein [Gemmatimonadota bacterium]MBT5965646.1 PilZ domain-containing protein [Gemmatimonadota bacterium]